MAKTGKKKSPLGALLSAAVLAGATKLYGTRLETMASIKRECASGTPYDLYSMQVKYPYDLGRLIARGLGSDQAWVDAVLAEALPLVPVHVQPPYFGCSAFSLTRDGGALMGRNYDFRFDTSALAVRCAPEDGYASLAFCALDNLRANNPLASAKTRMACLAAPFACLDGINEKGVSIAVLTLDSAPTRQRTGKPQIATSIAIRLVLDRAATTQEAVDLLAGYDMCASAGRDYHFYISDAQGDGRVVEYDCDDPARPLVASAAPQVTNFFYVHREKVAPNQTNGIYGHGRERYDAIEAVLAAAHEGESDREVAWRALRAASQEPRPEDLTSNTQWSIVFDNRACTADIALRRRWDTVHRVAVDGSVRPAPAR